MPDSHLPAVRPDAGDLSASSRPLPGGGDAKDRVGGAERPPRRGEALLTWLTGGALLVVGLLVTLGVAAMVGPAVRRAALISLEVGSQASRPALTDAPEEATRFFSGRDTVRVSVPWDMTVAEFLGLYHLENNPAARTALREQLGATLDEDILREGDEVTVTLTLTRPGG